MSGAAGAPRPTADTAPAPADAALGGRCPRCGARTLFDGLLGFAPRCRACGLDFSAFNVGDGPAAFLTLIVGALITGLAIALELVVAPPAWLHILLWPPLAVVAVIATLRFAKALMLALEYRHAAGEGPRGGGEG